MNPIRKMDATRRKAGINDYDHIRDQLLELKSMINLIKQYNQDIVQYKKEIYSDILNVDMPPISFYKLRVKAHENEKIDTTLHWLKNMENDKHLTIVNILYHANYRFTGKDKDKILNAVSNLFIANQEIDLIALDNLVEQLDKIIGNKDHTPLLYKELKGL